MIGNKNNTHIIWLLVIGIYFFVACNNEKSHLHADENKKYTCPMHPEIIKNEPGTCPICKMDLVLMDNKHTVVNIDSSLTDLILKTNETIVSNVSTIVLKKKNVRPKIELNGELNYNKNMVKTISSKISGRIEKMYIQYNFEKVNKGQKIMEVYSPDLLALQQELLYLKSKNEKELFEKAKQKLFLAGLTQQQVNTIIATNKATQNVAVFSNYSGYITQTNNESSENFANTPLLIKQGDYINTGDVLFSVFNADKLWADFYTNPSEGIVLKAGDELEISINNRIIRQKIDLILPFYKNQQSFKLARVYLNNSQQNFKVGSIVKAQAQLKPVTGLFAPTKSIYTLGQKHIAFVKKSGTLTVKEVKIGLKTEEGFLIKSGLSEGETIAENASYLIDSESFIIQQNNEVLN